MEESNLQNLPEMQVINQDLLLRLCNLLGIEGEFYDYKGEHHISSPAVRQKLIHALGFAVYGDQDAQALIEKLENENWSRLLPPVAVLHEHWDKAIEINIDEQDINTTIQWQISSEQGKRLSKVFLPQEQEYLNETRINNRRILRYRLRFSDDLPAGYHVLKLSGVENAGLSADCSLIVAPRQCYQPETLQKQRRLWGLSIQLYELRSERNWGIGDYTDLQTLIGLAAENSADFIGLNPMHALTPANPHNISPYSPSSRLFLNYMYIDIEACEDYQECKDAQALVNAAKFQAELAASRQPENVDYVKVAELKLKVLRQLHKHFKNRHQNANTGRAQAFNEFIEQGGETLRNQAVFDALYEKLFNEDPNCGTWAHWPEYYRRPDTAEVNQYQQTHADEVGFYQYLQWLSDQQFAAAQQAASKAGMGIGLYRDLAVGVNGGGAEAWGEQDIYSFNASAGAPPDPLALQGQDWGLPPMNPRALRETGYAAFIKLIRANMQHCGALRIDHVMGMLRLWWVPEGEIATEGSYVYYPLHDLLGILALESHRQQCMVIGEDLGTVPEEIRTALPEANVYSYKVAYFEKENEHRFKPPHHYAPQAMATITTHDLPTLTGWWEGIDLKMRDDMALFPNEEIRRQEYQAREQDRWALLKALQETGSLPDNITVDFQNLPEMTPALIEAVHKQLARSNAALMVVHPEDLLMMRTPTNVPGTTTEHANWQRKLVKNTDEIFSPAVRKILQTITEHRRG